MFVLCHTNVVQVGFDLITFIVKYYSMTINEKEKNTNKLKKK